MLIIFCNKFAEIERVFVSVPRIILQISNGLSWKSTRFNAENLVTSRL
jgi:hypothetical protein